MYRRSEQQHVVFPWTLTVKVSDSRSEHGRSAPCITGAGVYFLQVEDAILVLGREIDPCDIASSGAPGIGFKGCVDLLGINPLRSKATP